MDASHPYPRIDAHVHARGPKANLVSMLDALGIQKVLNLSYSDFLEPEPLQAYEDALRVDMEKYPGRFLFVPAFSVRGFGEPGYADRVIAKLARDIDERGAVAVKIWKDLGMMLQDSEGRHIFCDDPHFLPIFDYIASRRLPIVCHIADPLAAWLPLDVPSPHTEYFRTHPEFHWYGKPGKPSHEGILRHRDALIARFPDTVFVAAHLASLEHDLAQVSRFLDTYPNAHVDTAARIPDLMLKPRGEVRDFFIKYQDRILYATDWEYEGRPPAETPERSDQERKDCTAGYRRAFAYFEEYLALPPEVLRKFYFENAAALYAAPNPGK